MTNSPVKRDSSFWMSILLIGVGGLILLNNLDILDIGNLWHFWPLLLVGIGLIKLFTSNFRDLYSSGILIGIGTLFFLDEQNFLSIGDVFDLWPLVLIFIGGRIIWNIQNGGKVRDTSGLEVQENRVDGVAIFGGREIRVDSQEFQGGSLSVMFGGMEVFLGNSRPAEGGAALDVFVMFGGAEIRVPDNWRVVQKTLPLFGGFSDSRKSLVETDELSKNVLIINGFVIFGGVEIKSA